VHRFHYEILVLEVRKGGVVLLLIVLAILGTLLIVPAFWVLLLVGMSRTVPEPATLDNNGPRQTDARTRQ